MQDRTLLCQCERALTNRHFNSTKLSHIDIVEEMAITTGGGGEVSSVDWLELPEHLTSHILSYISCITDCVRFGAVCVQWKSIFDNEETTKSLLRPQLPLLMIPTTPSILLSQEKNKNKKEKSSVINSCSFYRVTDGKIFNRLQLTMPSDRYVRGSSHGWLITVDQDEICYSVQLMNPFYYPKTSTKEIKLPPLSTHPINKNKTELHYIHLHKAILSADPVSNPKDFIVMMIFSDASKLALCRPGDEAWIPIRDNMRGCFDDVIYYKDKFYAVDFRGHVVVCDVSSCTATTFAGPPVTEIYSRKYLVMSSGELLQVHRHMNDNKISDVFKIFKLRKTENDWVEVKDLDNHALFLGDNASISISASDFPGCKPNCIYYTDDLGKPEGGPIDLGVFNLENGLSEKHYPTDANIQLLPAPIWIEPTLPRIITRSRCNSIKKPLNK